MRHALEVLRRSPRVAEVWRLAPGPAWLASDRLNEVYRLHEQLLAEGEITWAWVVMANESAWRPGGGVVPGMVIYSFDPWFERRPSRLGPISERLLQQPDRPGVWPWEAQVSDWIAKELARPLDEPLPPSLALGRAVRLSTMLFFPDHLPHGYLTGGFLPVLVLREGPSRPAMGVPSSLWPAELVERWAPGPRR